MIDRTLTMIPGPTPVHPRVLAALARPTVSHQAPEFVASYRGCLEDLRRIVMSETAQPFVVSGSGTFAMEMALVNLVGPGERLLVVSHGYFGDRWDQVADAFGIARDVLRAPWGETVDAGELARRLGDRDYAAVALTHVDTSTGTASPIPSYREVLADRNELVLLDGVCATGGIEQRFDDWGLDVLLTGAQKAFGAPPGLAVLAVSPRGMARRRMIERVPAYSGDLLRWLPVMENPARYFSTPPVNEILAFAEAARIVLEEGLPARFERHRRLAAALRAGLAALGLQLFTDPACRADTLSVVRLPAGVDDAVFRGAMAARGVIVAGGLGPIAGSAFRIGHMGNVGMDEILITLDAVESALVEAGQQVERGRAVAAAARA